MREYLQITPEATWGTFNSGGAHTFIQLTDSNSFTVRPVPMRWEIRTACAQNRRMMAGSSKTQVIGALNNLVVFGSQATLWASMINLTGTPPAPLDLPSYTIDHAIRMEDGAGTVVYRRYLGCKVGQWQFSAAADTQLLRLSLNWIGKAPAPITAADFPDPGAGACAMDAPFVLENAATFTLGSTGSRPEFDRFQATGVNVFDPTYFNSQTITRLGLKSRNVDGQVTFPYVVATDRADLEAVTPHPASCTFTIGAHSLGFNFESADYTMAVADQLDYNRVFLQGITFAAYYDPAAGTDFTLSAT